MLSGSEGLTKNTPDIKILQDSLATDINILLTLFLSSFKLINDSGWKEAGLGDFETQQKVLTLSELLSLFL